MFLLFPRRVRRSPRAGVLHGGSHRGGDREGSEIGKGARVLKRSLLFVQFSMMCLQHLVLKKNVKVVEGIKKRYIVSLVFFNFYFSHI